VFRPPPLQARWLFLPLLFPLALRLPPQQARWLFLPLLLPRAPLPLVVCQALPPRQIPLSGIPAAALMSLTKLTRIFFYCFSN